MALQRQTKQFNFGQGIDTKTASEMMPIGRLHAAENIQFLKTGKISKKQGATVFPSTKVNTNLDQGGTLPAAKSAFTHQNGLYQISTQSAPHTPSDAIQNVSPDDIYSWVPSLNSWTWCAQAGTCLAKSQDIGIKQDASSNYLMNSSEGFSDCVYVDPFLISVSTTSAVNNTSSFINIVDPLTNEVVLSQSFSGYQKLRLVKLSAHRAIVIGVQISSGSLVAYNIDTTSLSFFSATIPISGAIHADYIYDAFVAPFNGIFYYAYKDLSGTLTVKQITSVPVSGSPTITASITIAETPTCIGIFGGELTFQKIYIGYGISGNTKFAICPLNLASASVVATGIIEALTIVGATATDSNSNYVAAFIGNGSIYSFGLNATAATALTSGNESGILFISSKVTVRNGISYFLVANLDINEPTYFLVYLPQATTGIASWLRPMAKLLFGTAQAFNLTGYVSNFSSDGSYYYIAGGKFALASYDATGVIGRNSNRYQAIFMRFDFGDSGAPEFYQNTETAGLTYFNGGFPCAFDGRSFFEAAFLHSPFAFGGIDTSGGSLVPDAQYFVCHVFEYVDAHGHRHQSAPSIPVTVTIDSGLGHNALLYAGFKPFLSLHNVVDIAVYRTTANGSIFYREFYIEGQVPNGQLFAGIKSVISDAVLQTHEILYTSGNVIENQCPTATSVVSVWQDRVFCNTDDGVVYSKEISDGVPAAFNPALAINDVIGKGRPKGLAPLRDKFLFFYPDDIYYIAGTGPTDVGIGEFTPLELASRGIGCAGSIPIVASDDTVYFQSRNGWRSINQALQISYVGIELDYFISEASSVTYAVFIDSLHQLRFSDGFAVYSYDTIAQQWSRNPLWADNKGFLWTQSTQKNKLFVRQTNHASQLIYEDPAAFQDSGGYVSMLVRTGWINLDQFLGYERLYKIILLGRYYSPHNLEIKLFYDYLPKVAETFTYHSDDGTFAQFTDAQLYENDTYAGAGFPMELQVKPARQKCQVVRIEITDTPLSGSGQSLDLIGMNLILGVKAVDAKLRDIVTATGASGNVTPKTGNVYGPGWFMNVTYT